MLPVALMFLASMLPLALANNDNGNGTGTPGCLLGNVDFQFCGTLNYLGQLVPHVRDGVCDDGGPGAEFGVCWYGTDLSDCGSRAGCDNVSQACPWGNRDDLHYCIHASDGDCDDGGPGAEHSLCPFGTDLTDCGPRPSCGVRNATYCHLEDNGECDDGGAGARTFWCVYGSDENDCGGDRPPAPPSGPAGYVSSRCRVENDGVCDDGGPGAEFYSCPYGSDEFDCGGFRPPAPPFLPAGDLASRRQSRCNHHNVMEMISIAFAVAWCFLLVVWLRLISSDLPCSSRTQVHSDDSSSLPAGTPTPAAEPATGDNSASLPAATPTPAAEPAAAAAGESSGDGNGLSDGSSSAGCGPNNLRVLLFLVPFFHLGMACVDLYIYSMCECLVCYFASKSSFYTYLIFKNVFEEGRLTALLLCLFVIASGAGTVRPRLGVRQTVLLVVLFGGFISASFLGLPLTVHELGTDETAAFIATVSVEAIIFLVVQLEASAQCRVLVAQVCACACARARPWGFGFQLRCRRASSTVAYDPSPRHRPEDLPSVCQAPPLHIASAVRRPVLCADGLLRRRAPW